MSLFTIVEWQTELEKPQDQTKLYRAYMNSEGDCVYFEAFQILKLTPTGAQIDLGYKTKFVSLTARKQWASRTRKEALRQLYWRWKKWQGFIHRDLTRCVSGLELLTLNKDLWKDP